MKTIQNRVTELLAPAKDVESGMAAINAGADALYIGAGSFGAREKAGNSIADIERLAAYAHKYYGKVYAAMNILLFDNELDSAYKLICHLYDAGIDALIIQDMAILEMDIPPIPLFASTQMHNTTPEKVKLLEDVGFQRVILARELSIKQIAQIRKETSVPLECFVHGALCVSYSGQCYMSYAIGGRSGNRGRCAQPCRKSYTLYDGSGKKLEEELYLLSLKDMNRSENLEDLLHAGVSSFKIEGRMKDISYVTNVVSYYREKLDKILEGKNIKKSSSGKTKIHFIPNPDKTFNRGYSNYNLLGDNRNMASIYTPKARGEKIGHVSAVKGDYFIMSNPHDLDKGDGICFFDKENRLDGTMINSTDGSKIFPDRIKGISVGTLIYRNHDHQFIKKLAASPPERKIDLYMNFSEGESGFSLTVTDEDGNSATVITDIPKEKAKDKDKAIQTIKKQLSKVGSTIFEVKELCIRSGENYFLPVSVLNNMRREATELLLKEREKNRSQNHYQLIKNNVPYFEEKLSYLGNVLNKKAEAFYRRHGVKEIEAAAESGINMSGKKVMTTRYCILPELELCGKKYIAPFYIEDREGNRFRLEFNCIPCEMEIFAL